MDTKTPEQLAEHHATLRCPEQGPEFIVWCMCRDDFLAGYHTAYNIAYELGFEEALKAQKTLTYI